MSGHSGGLPRHRYAEVFEARRDRADAHTASTGSAPTVFLATLGPIAAHTARATFTANLLAAGGIATSRGPVTTDAAKSPGPGRDVASGEVGGASREQAILDAIAEAFAASGSSVACVCGSDKAYPDLAGPVATALKAAGAARVWLAGKPGDYDGVDHYLYLGCNAIEVIDSVLTDLGVA